MIFDIEDWFWKSNFGTFWQLSVYPKVKIRVRVKHALRRPRTPSGALTRPQLSQTQNHTPSYGCKTPWGSTRCTPSFRPLPPPIKLRAPFTLKGKTRPQLFFGIKSWGRLLSLRVKHALRPKNLLGTSHGLFWHGHKLWHGLYPWHGLDYWPIGSYC